MVRIHRLVALAAAAVLTFGVTAALDAGPVAQAATPLPQNDPFYTPPSPLPAGKPGDIIRSRPSAAPQLVPGSIAYQVLYLSTNALGRPDAVSGTILLPKTAVQQGLLAKTPVIGFGSGTQGLGDQCAPSAKLLANADYDALYLASEISQGYAVAVTDYEGLGTPGNHTWNVGRSEGPAVIDSVRAAVRLGVGLSASSKVAFVGYSQGGGAAAWASELQPTYAPELHVVAAAEGGVPADLSTFDEDGGLVFGAEVMGLAGFDAAYPDIDIAPDLTPKGTALITQIRTQCVVDIFSETAFHHLAPLVTVDPFTTPAWLRHQAENKLGTMKPSSPVFLFQGSFDEIVPPAQADTLHKTYCSMGVPVLWKTYPGEHLTTFAEAAVDVSNFLAARFAGEPPVSSC
jgi:pimeloyl-ACP methyl ester carboxylesterase